VGCFCISAALGSCIIDLYASPIRLLQPLPDIRLDSTIVDSGDGSLDGNDITVDFGDISVLSSSGLFNLLDWIEA
jgi:hypothetical protein